MKKFLITSLFACLAMFQTTTSVSATTIYTGMPDVTDSYYQPFTKSLKSFNSDLQHQATTDNRFVALDTQPEKFRTLNYYYPDIWLRDVAPVVTTKMVKFRYAPSYLPKSDSNYLNKRFNKFLGQKYNYQKSSLILDGGNVQWNGAQTIILTNKVLEDNPDWTKQEIVTELKQKLAVKRVILISKEPGDVLGHSDGMVKFISAHRLFINDFNYEPGFLKKIERQIKAQDPQIHFVVLPSAYTSKNQYDKKIASAKSLYINMLETKQKIYFPIYGLKSDEKVKRMVQKETDKTVVPINVGKISTLGGSIHCLTWDAPNKFLK